MEQKICKNCGKEVIAEGRNLFCCAGCQSIYYNKIKFIIKICKYCGKEFETKNNRKIYCCSKCRYKSKNKKLRDKKKENIINVLCAYCGKDFILKRNNQKYCNVMCRRKSEKVLRKQAKQFIINI